jgi:site-specific recombinase XerD
VPLSDGAQEALQALEPLTKASGYVIPQVHPDALTAAFRRHLERAGLPGHLHCLRHTFCAALVSAGVPLRTVQVLAGHASITTTERYAHLAPDAIQHAVRFLKL